MPTILLVRHGQASYGAECYDRLSEVGKAQSVSLGRTIAERELEPVRVLAGSGHRHRETAALAFGPDKAVEIDERWDEYETDRILAAYGRDGGASFRRDGQEISSTDFQGVLDEALTRWVAAGPAGDFPSFVARGKAALDDLVAGLSRGETAVVITSGGVIGNLCSRLLGFEAEAFVQLNRVCVNSGMTILTAGRRGISLVTFNEHSHLVAPGTPEVTYR